MPALELVPELADKLEFPLVFLVAKLAFTESSPCSSRPSPARVLPCTATKDLKAEPATGLAESARPMLTGPLDSMRVRESV